MFDFLGLPAELRNMIYSHSLISNTPLQLPIGSREKAEDITTALLLTNRQIYNEGMGVYYANNTIILPDCGRNVHPHVLEHMNTVQFRLYPSPSNSSSPNPMGYWYELKRAEVLKAAVTPLYEKMMKLSPDKKKRMITELDSTSFVDFYTLHLYFTNIITSGLGDMLRHLGTVRTVTGVYPFNRGTKCCCWVPKDSTAPLRVAMDRLINGTDGMEREVDRALEEWEGGNEEGEM